MGPSYSKNMHQHHFHVFIFIAYCSSLCIICQFYPRFLFVSGPLLRMLHGSWMSNKLIPMELHWKHILSVCSQLTCTTLRSICWINFLCDLLVLCNVNQSSGPHWVIRLSWSEYMTPAHLPFQLNLLSNQTLESGLFD